MIQDRMRMGGLVMQEIIFGVLGGLALFIYGMNLMSEGLKRKQGITTLSGSPPVTVTPGRQWSLTN